MILASPLGGREVGGQVAPELAQVEPSSPSRSLQPVGLARAGEKGAVEGGHPHH